jgi:hypothetical protein
MFGPVGCYPSWQSTSFNLILTIPHVLFAPLYRSASITLLAYSRRFFLYYLGKGADHTVKERSAANRPNILEVSGRRKLRRFPYRALRTHQPRVKHRKAPYSGSCFSLHKAGNDSKVTSVK